MVRRSSAPGTTLLVIAALVAGACQSTNSASGLPSPTGSPLATGSPSLSASVIEPTSSPPSETVPPSGVSFTKKVSTKRWGDPPFKVLAIASDGGAVSYSANGSCDVGPVNGSVSIKTVGSCTITATEANHTPTATDSMTIAIEPGRPAISFGESRTRFTRDMQYPLNASTDPAIDLAYEVVHGAKGSANDEMCEIKGDALVWDKTPTAERFPQLDAFCMVKVTAKRESKNYVTPSPVQALIHIDYPNWKVHATAQTVSYADGSDPTVTVFEDTGDALGIDLSSESFLCGNASTPVAVSMGTTKYRIAVHVEDPAQYPDEVDANGAYTCTFTATALPPDWQNGSKGKASDTFILTVTP